MYSEINVGKSVRVAMAMNGLNGRQLAKKLDVSEMRVSQLVNTAPGASVETKTLDGLCQVFDMKMSELIAIGEE